MSRLGLRQRLAPMSDPVPTTTPPIPVPLPDFREAWQRIEDAALAAGEPGAGMIASRIVLNLLDWVEDAAIRLAKGAAE